ncbi:hypothetical protein A1O3_09257 [Capronia epimyces CBS 606.96]|uniref:BRCA1-associated protein n=1 Tax=Capronia epimyces CBS 606.96 TaxID=1182542 RepID=W9XM90_9EURO|nr:uncharacterized protein A1O3_09257 [Capronia epimyces CBS 606.96]EXJ78096.1 hypothetical protein A1O3_09257 [Capronia epimyces CBS 606.96]
MPDYFFYVVIELFTDSPASLNQPKQLQPPSLAPFFKSLRPFTTSVAARRRSRDLASEHRKEFSAQPARSQPTVSHENLSLQIPHPDPKDHRLDRICVESADTPSHPGGMESAGGKDNIIGKGIGSAISGRHMKGRYEALESHDRTEGWGIVHLYRDSEQTSGLYKDSAYRSSDLWSDGLRNPPSGNPHPPPKDEACTTLCILAVPSYMTPSDFLSWVGEDTRSEVSHFRMVRTARANRYMVLMKFRHGKKAREWQHEWHGKVFNSMEPETCQVVFLKSVELIQTSSLEPNNSLTSPTTSYPNMTNDPFIPTSTTAKPPAPRTSSLVELPTCPVCLERMDETTGLLTIPCQHVFHCTCMEKWSGGGCPVCRYTHDDFSSRLGSYKANNKTSGEYEGHDGPLECEVCHVETSLWQCIICGKVGCGRYEGKHAYAHFEDTGHTFSMDLQSKRVWDYAGDTYVHRIIQDAAKPGEKLVELPGRHEPSALHGEEDPELAKLDDISLEYTHLLTSQLESQRVYFEEVVERAVDKAAEATKKAERALEESRVATEKLQRLEREHDIVAKGHVPGLEKEKARLEKRSAKFEELARSFSEKYQVEKTLSASLMERVEFLEKTQLRNLHETIRRLEEENATQELLMEGLREEHRDAIMQISAQRKLEEMVANGELEAEDLEGAVIEAGPAKKVPLARRRKLANEQNRGAGSSAPSQPLPASSPTSREGPVDRLVLYNSIFGESSRGKDWDEQKAKRILDECRAKLLSEGLLVSPTPSVSGRTESSEGEDDGNGENKAKGTSAGKKRKGKKKSKKQNI